jgi:hypothetical protein
MKRTLIICVFLFLVFPFIHAQDVAGNEVSLFVSKGETEYLQDISMWGVGFRSFFVIDESSFLEINGDFGFKGQPNNMKYEREYLAGRFDLGLLKGKTLDRIILMLRAQYYAEAKIFPEKADTLVNSEWWRKLEASFGIGARILGEYDKSYFTVTSVLGILNFKNHEVIRESDVVENLKLTEELVWGVNFKSRYQAHKNFWIDGEMGYMYPAERKEGFYEVRFGFILKPTERFGIRADFSGMGYDTDPRGKRSALTMKIGASYFF